MLQKDGSYTYTINSTQVTVTKTGVDAVAYAYSPVFGVYLKRTIYLLALVPATAALCGIVIFTYWRYNSKKNIFDYFKRIRDDNNSTRATKRNPPTY